MHGASSRFVLHSLQRDRRLVFARGRGSRLWDVEGREYMDAVSGTNGPAAVGHAHPDVAAAVAEQMATLPSTFIVHDSVPVVLFAERLAGLAPEGLSRTFLCPGGGDAVEAAVKLAALVTGRPGVVSLEGAYHGMSLGTMSLAGLPSLRAWFPGGVRWPHFEQVPAPRAPSSGQRGEDGWRPALAALEAALEAGHVAAVILELVQGPGGHVELPRDYCRAVERICRERGTLLVLDEVQTGLGRCGSFWATDLYGLRPDMIVIGKAFGGGVPFGGVVVRDDLVTAEVERAPWHILTFMNQPLQAAAGLAVLHVVERERLVERARVLGVEARRHLEALAERYRVVGEVRGPGLFLGLELVESRGTGAPATRACAEAWEHALDLGLLTWFGGPGGNVLKLKPPLTTPDDDLARMLDLVEEVVAGVERRVHGRANPRPAPPARPVTASRTQRGERMTSVTESMSTVTRYTGRGTFEIERARPPVPVPGEVLVRVEAAGICGTDLHITRVPTTYVASTEVLGHEICGEVVQGPSPLVGTRVVVDPAITCGRCGPCLRGLPTQCPNFEAIGVTRPGGFADFVAVPEGLLRPIPPTLDLETAVLAEPLACVMYALRQLPALDPSGRAVVLGAGPIGALFALVLERGLGRRVAVSEPSEERRALLAPKLEGEVLAPEALEHGEPPELVVDTTGFLFGTAVRIARPGGTILAFGLADRGGASAQVLFTQKELTAVSSFAAHGTFGLAIDLLARGVLGRDDVVTAVRPLAAIGPAFDEARAGHGLKVLLRPGAT